MPKSKDQMRQILIAADHAVFVGFAPIDQPAYSIAVIVEHGGGGIAYLETATTGAQANAGDIR